MTKAQETDRCFPGRAPLDAYGNGGFRFADMSHRGSLLLLPSGIYACAPIVFDAVMESDFVRVFAEASELEFLLLGCGPKMLLPTDSLRAAFRKYGLGFEFMDTGAAARTYNVLLGEKRAVAAALIAVDEPVQTR